MYSLKSLNLNATKVTSYDKLRAEADEAMDKKARLEGQLNQVVMDRVHYKVKRNLSKSEKAKLEEKIAELEGKITKLELEVASLTNHLDT